MDFKDRISHINNEIAVSKFAVRQYREALIESIGPYLESINSLDDTGRRTIELFDARFLDRDFIENLKNLGFDEVQEVKKDLGALMNNILLEIEGNIS